MVLVKRKVIIFLPLLLVITACKKINIGICKLELNGGGYGTIYYNSEIIRSTKSEIIFNGDEISGTLTKSGKNVKGVLALGNPSFYTFTVTITGNVSSKNRIEGVFNRNNFSQMGNIIITR